MPIFGFWFWWVRSVWGLVGDWHWPSSSNLIQKSKFQKYRIQTANTQPARICTLEQEHIARKVYLKHLLFVDEQVYSHIIHHG